MIHLSSSFSWNINSKHLVTYASDLGRGGFMDNMTYVQAVDGHLTQYLFTGFGIISQHTGEEIHFELTSTVKDAENDIVRWVFDPIPAHAHRARPDTKVVIYND